MDGRGLRVTVKTERLNVSRSDDPLTVANERPLIKAIYIGEKPGGTESPTLSEFQATLFLLVEQAPEGGNWKVAVPVVE